ncbi:MAG: hypothetical protein ACYS15_14840 [Planctomycetota bacterium]|jgi:hypothetical protein
MNGRSGPTTTSAKPAVIAAPPSSSVPQRPCQKPSRHIVTKASTRTSVHVAVAGVSHHTATSSASKRYGRIGFMAELST